jgi:hypothetical protein
VEAAWDFGRQQGGNFGISKAALRRTPTLDGAGKAENKEGVFRLNERGKLQKETADRHPDLPRHARRWILLCR